MAKRGQKALGFCGAILRKIQESELQFLGDLRFPEHVSRVYFAREISTRVNFVVKTDIHPQDIVAEAVGWLLSREIGVETPDAAVLVSASGASVGWASKQVEAAMGWHDSIRYSCDQCDIAAIFVLDAVIGNADRHADNVLVEDLTDDEPKTLYSIDLADSAIGDAESFCEMGRSVRSVGPMFWLNGVDPAEIEGNANTCLERCQILASEQGKLEGLLWRAGECMDFLNLQRQGMLLEALRDRLLNAESLMQQLLDATLRRT